MSDISCRGYLVCGVALTKVVREAVLHRIDMVGSIAVSVGPALSYDGTGPPQRRP